jgi:hypothetical protein
MGRRSAVKCKYIGEKGEMEDKMGSMVGYRNNDAGIVYEIQGLRTFKIEYTCRRSFRGSVDSGAREHSPEGGSLKYR